MNSKRMRVKKADVEVNDHLPYPRLQLQQGFEIKYQNFYDAPHQIIHIVWDDDFAKSRNKDIVIDM